MIPIFSNSLGKEELEAVEKVFKSKWVGSGERTLEFENQFGGRFEVIDPNALYPTWQQPRVPINAAYGGAVNGTGSGTSDSIPARLSDGEFVMTADAVRGAGNGNRKDGVRKMYELMNNLEGR